MSTSFLRNLPDDILLLISSLLQSEDSLNLVQVGSDSSLITHMIPDNITPNSSHLQLLLKKTCRSLYNLTTIRVFWLATANALQQRRRVHYQPLERLDIPQLRDAVLHTLKLDLKWSGRNGVDDAPRRCREIGPLLPMPAPPEPVETNLEDNEGGEGYVEIPSHAVTWVWFLEDGEHIICVTEDTFVQLWNLIKNEPVLSFNVGGKLLRASQYSDKEYLLIGGSVGFMRKTEAGDYEVPTFALWRYKWGTAGFTPDLTPTLFHHLPVHLTSIFLSNTLIGVLYVAGRPKEYQYIPSTSTKAAVGEREDPLGYLTFLLMEWKDPGRIIFRFTPMSFFGAAHTQRWKDDFAHCIRIASRLAVIFDCVTSADVYTYNLRCFDDLFTSPALAAEAELSGEMMVYPQLKCTYGLSAEDIMRWCEADMRHSWAQPTLLWDGYRIGILGYCVSIASSQSKRILSLSVLDLSILLAPGQDEDGKDVLNYDLQGEYKRTFVPTSKWEDYERYGSRSYGFLGSLPRNATNTIWALTWPNHPLHPNKLNALGIAQFSPEHGLQDGLQLATGCNDVPDPLIDSVGLGPMGKVLQIELVKFPELGEAEDIDLDDRLGRVAFGMNSGQVFILEFV